MGCSCSHLTCDRDLKVKKCLGVAPATRKQNQENQQKNIVKANNESVGNQSVMSWPESKKCVI